MFLGCTLSRSNADKHSTLDPVAERGLPAQPVSASSARDATVVHHWSFENERISKKH